MLSKDGWECWPRSFNTCLKQAKDKIKELGQYPAILTSRLVNNPYILSAENRSTKIDTDDDSATIYFDFSPKDYIVNNIMYVMIRIIYLNEMFGMFMDSLLQQKHNRKQSQSTKL